MMKLGDYSNNRSIIVRIRQLRCQHRIKKQYDPVIGCYVFSCVLCDKKFRRA